MIDPCFTNKVAAKKHLMQLNPCCQKCKWKKVPKVLHIHHKDRNPLNNQLSNLELLCPNCHAIEHITKIKRNPNKKIIEQLKQWRLDNPGWDGRPWAAQ